MPQRAQTGLNILCFALTQHDSLSRKYNRFQNDLQQIYINCANLVRVYAHCTHMDVKLILRRVNDIGRPCTRVSQSARLALNQFFSSDIQQDIKDSVRTCIYRRVVIRSVLISATFQISRVNLSNCQVGV